MVDKQQELASEKWAEFQRREKLLIEIGDWQDACPNTSAPTLPTAQVDQNNCALMWLMVGNPKNIVTLQAVLSK